jgi:hypothetical protein
MSSLSQKINSSKEVLEKIHKRVVSFSVIDTIFLYILKIKEKKENVFYTTHKRPKTSSDVSAHLIEYAKEPLTAIVMQGQIITNNNFTLETTILYKKFFPKAQLILSTWINEDASTIEKIKQHGWIVIQNEKPSYPGHYNINYQITSSINGILAAKNLNVEYVLKTRTDQRMYNPNALGLLHHMSELYPPNNKEKQTKRLIVPNIGTFKYRPYGIGDMIMFGHVDDMERYWNAEHDMRNDILNKYPTVIEIAKIRKTEVYLCTEYLKKINQTPLWTLDDSWKIFGNYFCIFDSSLLDMFWYKYKVHEENRFHYYNMTHTHQVMHYYEWVSCYKNTYNPASLPEKILTTKIGEALPKNTNM